MIRRQARIVLSLAFVFLTAGRLRAQTPPPVTNVLFGLICDSTGQGPQVCADTRAISISGRSSCVYNRVRHPCTWFGFSFDYDLSSSDTTLNCKWSSSAPQNSGNPDTVLANAVDAGSYDLDLPSHRGHFVNPQYTLFTPGLATTTRETQECSYQGRVVFSLSYAITLGDAN
jgi:hypothetical protein